MTTRTVVDASQMLAVADKIRGVPQEFRQAMRPQLRTAGELVKASAAANAAWSSRIPAALRVRVRLSGRNMGVQVQADRKAAPHARPFEGVLQNPFRHPVYGDRNVWVSQAARPFLFPAARAKRGDIVNIVDDAVGTAFERAGVTR